MIERSESDGGPRPWNVPGSRFTASWESFPVSPSPNGAGGGIVISLNAGQDYQFRHSVHVVDVTDHPQFRPARTAPDSAINPSTQQPLESFVSQPSLSTAVTWKLTGEIPHPTKAGYVLDPAWTIANGTGRGSIDSTGLYTAPAVVTSLVCVLVVAYSELAVVLQAQLPEPTLPGFDNLREPSNRLNGSGHMPWCAALMKVYP